MSTLPTKIGKYDVVALIGRAGLGLVYDAVDPDVGRPVVIKAITGPVPLDADDVNCFWSEAQPAAGLQHPNIVNIYDAGVHEGNPYMVTEYLDGESLEAALKGSRALSLFDKINIAICVCRGLAYAHQCGIAHYGIQPASIVLCNDGMIRIADFAIAHAASQALIRTGDAVGPLSYMAPEQLELRTTDYRADIFSMGVVLYQLISNHHPFEGDSPVSTIFKIMHEPTPSLNTFRNDYAPEIEAVLLRAMAKNPAERYSSADDFAFALERLMEHFKDGPVRQERQDISSLEQDDVGKPVFRLWVQAEKALAEEHFEEAREHAEQALALDPEDAELQQLWQTIRVEAMRTEKLNTILSIARAAHAQGDLDAARNAAEEAMEWAPNNAEATALYQLISQEVLERARQRQIDSYLKDARQDISSRRFTGAIETLRRAEELDPNAPGVQSLIQLAVSSQQQERRREEIEALSGEIEDALNRDDYRTAVEMSGQGLARFPQERIFANLKAQAEELVQLAERSQIVDAELTSARGLFQAGRNLEAKARLEQVIAQLGPEPRLQSLLTAVSEELHRQSLERSRSKALHNVSVALTQQAYDDAIRILQDIAKEFDEDTELHERLDNVRSQRADLLQAALHGAEEELDLSHSKSILEAALQKLPGDRQLQEKLDQVSHLDQMVSKNVSEAKKLEEAGRYDQALAKWEMIQVLHPRHPDLKIAPKRIRNLQELARSDSRQNWIQRIEGAMRTFDYTGASALVDRATQEFPWDSDLMELQEKTEFGIRQRTKAQRILDEAQRLLSKQQWEACARTLMRACQAAPEDLLIRKRVVEGLRLASRDAMQKDPEAAESILHELAQIEPASAFRLEETKEVPAHSEMSVFDSSQIETAINIASPTPASGALVADTPPGVAEPTIDFQVLPLPQKMLIPAEISMDNVYFTATAPGSLLRGTLSDIHIWVHVEQQREAVIKLARQVQQPDDVEKPASHERHFPLLHSGSMSIRLRLGGGLQCVESHRWVEWTDEIGHASFVVTVPSEISEGDLVGLASIRLNGCQIAKLSFLLKIGSKMQAIQAIPCQTVKHRKAFASYASGDRAEVLARVRLIEGLFKGLKVYVDADALRSGTYWEGGLHSRIDSADVFYLFWSRRAIASDWVRREWRWALKSKGLDFIDPVPLESPEDAPPPDELAAKYFNDPSLPYLGAAGTGLL